MLRQDTLPIQSKPTQLRPDLELPGDAEKKNPAFLSEQFINLLSNQPGRAINSGGPDLALLLPKLEDIYRILNPAKDLAKDLLMQVQKELAAPKLPGPDKTSAADVKLGFSVLHDSIRAGAKDKITQDELELSIGNPEITGSQAQMLVIFKKMLDRFQALDPDAKEKRITQKAIDKFDQLQAKVGAGELKEGPEFDLVKDVEAELKRVNDIVKDTNRQLFANEKDPLKSINIEDVKQGPIGNCYFYGATGALVAVNKEAIKDLLKDNKDGTFTVSFPNKAPITVKAPSDAEIALFPKPGKDGVWMWVLEKAYGQHCMDHPGDDNPNGFNSLNNMLARWNKTRKSLCPQERTEGPSFVDDGLKILTGKKVGWIFNSEQAKMETKLAEIIAENPRRPMTADAHLGVTKEEGAPVAWHTYSVLDYDAKSKTITLRNPWGHTPPTVKGVTDLGNGKFSMDTATFCKYFSKLNYTEK